MPRPTLLELKVTEPTRVDLAIMAEFRRRGLTFSRNQLKDIFRKNEVLVLGRPVQPSLMLPAGISHVTFLGDVTGSPSRTLPSPRGSFLPVVYEDSEILVLNKTSGVASVPHGSEDAETAVASALAHAPEIEGVGPRPLEPGLLHRLDTGTSGLLAFAKSPESHDRLRTAWQMGQVRKIYRAICVSPSDHGLPLMPLNISPTLAHDTKSTKRMIVLDPTHHNKPAIRGKPLMTRTSVLEAKVIRSMKGTFDFEIEIHTGVMHQIRCTLNWLKWPVLGDPIYKGCPSHRLWLHAWKLEIPLQSGVTLALESALPDSWPTR